MCLFTQCNDIFIIFAPKEYCFSMEDRRSNYYWAIVDVEVGMSDHRIHDIGALRYDGAIYHGCKKDELMDFLRDVDYLCGHNIINHDAKYLFGDNPCRWKLVDTLYMSPLLFPERPYHSPLANSLSK